jgi:hypothetical protein
LKIELSPFSLELVITQLLNDTITSLNSAFPAYRQAGALEMANFFLDDPANRQYRIIDA